jgi:uncharacterized lipoprotein YajG
MMRLLLLLTLFVSCAQNQVILKRDQLKPFNEFSIKTKVADDLKSITIKQVIDARENQTSLGTALTGVQYKKTQIEVGQAPMDYVKSELLQGLVGRGVALNDDYGVAVEVTVNQLWVEELIEKYQPEKAKCNANFTFSINTPKKMWKGNYWTEITSPGDLSDGTVKIAPTLASCMNVIIEKLVNDKTFIENLK